MSETKLVGFDRAQLLAPLVIGVTGHRDLRKEDLQLLADKVQEIFLKFRKDYPATPLILISALAEGADRLVAEVALSPEVGMRVVAPLPLPLDVYEQDFESFTVVETPLATVGIERSSRQEFRDLLDRTDWFELGLAEGNSYEMIAEPGEPRDRQYEAVGKYIARQNQILIALWDGVESDALGGTASVIRFQTEGVPGSDVCELEPAEGFPVYHILTPRLKNRFPPGEVLNLLKIYPAVFQGNHVRAADYYHHMFSRLNEFNGYIAHADDHLADEAQKCRKSLPGMPEDEVPAGVKAILDRYAVVDALAIRFRKSWLSAQIYLHALVFASFFCFLLFADQSEHRLIFLILSVVLATGAFGLWTYFRKSALDARHEDYRAMAEGLRVKFYWKLAGVKESIADNYLGKQRSELDWIRNGFRGWNVAGGRQAYESSESSEGDHQRNWLAFAREHWINRQQDYYHGAAERNLEYHERFERAGLFCLAMVAVLVLFLGYRALLGDEFLDPVGIALEAFLALAAILHHFKDRMAYAEHAKQYQRMAALFTHGSALLWQFLDRKDYDNARRCVTKIGIEALTENGDWVLLHREKPLEVPHP